MKKKSYDEDQVTKFTGEPRPVVGIAMRLGDDQAIKEQLLFGGRCGDIVKIRPINDDKTYLGVLIGDVARSVTASFDAESGIMALGFSLYNPGIFVPDLGRLVYGAESWWGRIKNEAELGEITDGDIANVWYVQALKMLAARVEEPEAAS